MRQHAGERRPQLMRRVFDEAALGLLGLVVTIIVRSTQSDTEITLSAAQVAKLEAERLGVVA